MEQTFDLHDGRLEAAADMSFMFRDLENYGESLGNCWGEADGERMTLRRNGGRAAPRFPRFCHLAPEGLVRVGRRGPLIGGLGAGAFEPPRNLFPAPPAMLLLYQGL